MKATVKALAIAGALSLTAILGSACATPVPVGIIYTKVTTPVTVSTGELTYSKIGEAKCTSLFFLFASGDASIQAACRASGITKVKYVNYKANNICGIWGSYTTTVYGE